jgi:pyruvate-formate lyase-activating enzyme
LNVTHAIHDFTAKLRQPSLADHVAEYVRWRRAVARARSEGRPDPPAPPLAPISINLDLTTACNYRCDHCIDWDILNTKHRYREEALRESMVTMAERGLRSVILIGGGEPTLYPGFVDFVHFLKGLRLQVAVVTNGSRGDRLGEISDFLEEGDWIRLSLDSGSNELFRAMHKPVQKNLTLDAICEWIEKLKERNPGTRVGYSYIIVWKGATRDDVPIHENIAEIVMAAERARRYRFDYIAFKPVLERRPDGAEVMDPEHTQAQLDGVIARIRFAVERAKELQTESFQVYESINLRLLEEGNWRDFTRQPRTCHMQALRQVLSPMGLYNCPAHRGVPKALIAGPVDASHECQEVTCLYHDVNWWVESLIQQLGEGISIDRSPEGQDFFL